MYQIDFNHPSSIYFVGIGGISMSGLAEILKDAGFRVSGGKRDPASHQSAAFRRDHAELQDPYCHQRYSRQDHHDLHGQ